MFGMGRSTSDVFSGAASAAWHALPMEEQATFNARAASRRVLASANTSTMDDYLEQIEAAPHIEGPWNISSLQGEFPVHAGAVKEAMQSTTMRCLYTEWQGMFPEKVQPAENFPSEVPFDGPFIEAVPDAVSDGVARFLELVRLSLRYGDKTYDAGMLFELVVSDHDTMYILAPHSLSLQRDDFEAEILEMTVVGSASDGQPGLPFLVRFVVAPAPTGHDMPWPAIHTERQFACRLNSMSTDWVVHRLQNQPAGMSSRRVTGRALVVLADLRALDEERLMQRAAMALFRKVAGLTQPKPTKKSVKKSSKRAASSHVMVRVEGFQPCPNSPSV